MSRTSDLSIVCIECAASRSRSCCERGLGDVVSAALSGASRTGSFAAYRRPVAFNVLERALAPIFGQERAREAVVRHLPEIEVGHSEPVLNRRIVFVDVAAKVGRIVGIDRDA